MKKLKVFILLIFTVTATWAQSNLVAYEYWFNNDYANKQFVGITPSTTHCLTTDMDVASFPNGVNWFNIRYKDENGKYTAILSKSFVKIDLPTSAQSNLVAYEYWFNNDYANKQLIGITPNTTHYLNSGRWDLFLIPPPDILRIFNPFLSPLERICNPCQLGTNLTSSLTAK